jgi:hypothetical protein
MRLWQFGITTLCEDELLYEGPYENSVLRLTNLYSIMNDPSSSDGEKNNATSASERLLTRIEKDHGLDKATEARNTAKKNAYSKPSSSETFAYDIGDVVVFGDDCEIGEIIAVNKKYIIKTAHTEISIDEKYIRGKTRFNIGDVVMFNSRNYRILSFIPDGNGFKVKIQTKDGLINITSENNLKPSPYTGR